MLSTALWICWHEAISREQKARRSESEYNEKTNSSLAVWTEHAKKKKKLVGFVRGETKGAKK